MSICAWILHVLFSWICSEDQIYDWFHCYHLKMSLLRLDSYLFFTNYTSFMCLVLFLQRVADWISQSKELLKKRTSPDAKTALDLISNALHISPHSDSLMEMKAEALLMVCISFLSTFTLGYYEYLCYQVFMYLFSIC